MPQPRDVFREMQEVVADDIRAHEAQWGVLQDGDTVLDREGGLWQLRAGSLAPVSPPRRTPAPDGAHALPT